MVAKKGHCPLVERLYFHAAGLLNLISALYLTTAKKTEKSFSRQEQTLMPLTVTSAIKSVRASVDAE